MTAEEVKALPLDEKAALLAGRHPEWLRSTFRFYAYDFDPKDEAVTFTTRYGRLVFRSSDGTLQKAEK
jgi:hypothetical protein